MPFIGDTGKNRGSLKFLAQYGPWCALTACLFCLEPKAFLTTLFLAFGSVLLCAVISLGLVMCLMGQKTSWVYHFFERILLLWMVMPTLVLVALFFQAYGVYLGVSGTLLMMAASKFPFIFKPLMKARHGMTQDMHNLLTVSHASLAQKITWVYGPFFLPVVLQNMRLQMIYGIWSFSLPLLLCSGPFKPLSVTLYLSLLERGDWWTGGLILLWCFMTSFLLLTFEGLPFYSANQKALIHDKASHGSWGKLVLLVPMGVFIYPMILYGWDFAQDIGSLGLQLNVLKEPMGGTTKLVLSTLAMLVFTSAIAFSRDSISLFFLKFPMLFPKLFLGVFFGTLLMYFDWFPKDSILLYGILLSFLCQPYLLSLGIPVKKGVKKRLGALMATDPMMGWIPRWRHIWWPYGKKEVHLGVSYVVMAAVSDVSLFLCLSPMDGSTLSLELYDALSQWDWPRIRLMVAVYLCLIMIIPKEKRSERAGN